MFGPALDVFAKLPVDIFLFFFSGPFQYVASHCDPYALSLIHEQNSDVSVSLPKATGQGRRT